MPRGTSASRRALRRWPCTRSPSQQLHANPSRSQLPTSPRASTMSVASVNTIDTRWDVRGNAPLIRSSRSWDALVWGNRSLPLGQPQPDVPIGRSSRAVTGPGHPEGPHGSESSDPRGGPRSGSTLVAAHGVRLLARPIGGGRRGEWAADPRGTDVADRASGQRGSCLVDGHCSLAGRSCRGWLAFGVSPPQRSATRDASRQRSGSPIRVRA